MFKSDVSRRFERFIGVGLLLLSLVFGSLFLYFAVLAVRNGVYSVGLLVIELVVVLIAYSLAMFSVRLITGRGIKGSKRLLSNTALMIWGTVFGVSGIVELILFVMNQQVLYIAPAIVSIVMGLSAYNLVSCHASNVG